jgi:hypothetical protein
VNSIFFTTPEGCADWLTLAKTEIFQCRRLAARAVKAELIGLTATLGSSLLPNCPGSIP